MKRSRKIRPACAVPGCHKHGKPENAIKIHNGTLYYCEHHWYTVALAKFGKDTEKSVLGEAYRAKWAGQSEEAKQKSLVNHPRLPTPCKLERSVKLGVK